MSTIETVATIAIQPRDSFNCPSWCTKTHTEEDLGEWEYGQWTVTHIGKTHRWSTARATAMEARLTWTELVGSSAVLADEYWFEHEHGPVIELGGDDGSGYLGTHEILMSDMAAWMNVLAAIAAEVEA